MKPNARIVLIALALALTPALTHAASIGGTVTAGDGSLLPGVTIEVRHIATGQLSMVQTNEVGEYEVGDLGGGQYRVTAKLDGFTDVGQSLTLGADGAEELDLVMTHGALAEKMTVTAAKGERAVEEIPQQVTIISEKDLEERQILSAQRAIERAPNVRTIDTNPARARPQLRGLSSSRVLLLIDGERLNNVRFDAGATGISPGMVDITNVESIEVLGGAGSSLYGTDAMAGVINIITKSPTRLLGGTRTTVGFDGLYNDNDYTRAVVSVDHSTPKFTIRASASQFDAGEWEAGDGEVTVQQVLDAANFASTVAASVDSDVTTSFAIWDFQNGEKVANSGGDGNNASLDLLYYPNAKHSFRLKYLLSDHSDLGLPFSVPPFDPTLRANSFRDFDRTSIEYEGLDLASFMPRLIVRAYTQTFKRPQDDTRFNIDFGSSWAAGPTGLFFTGNPSTFSLGRTQATLNTVDSTGLEVRGTFTLGEKGLLTAGVSMLEDESADAFNFTTFGAGGVVTSSVSGVATTPNTTYENMAGFAALEWAPADWVRVSAGLRYDEWETQADPTAGYPPAPEAYLTAAALPQILARPGDIVTDGIQGVDRLVNGEGSIGTSSDVVTSNIGLTFPLKGGFHPFVRWGESYREPEVTVRYLVRNFGPPFISISGLPNTSLEPEEGETLDWGVKVARPNFRGSLTFFENDLENFIGTILSPLFFIPARPDLGLIPSFGTPFHAVQFFQRVNFSQVEIEGFELTAQASFELGNGGSITPALVYGETDTRLVTPDARRLAIVEEWYNRSDTPIRFEGSANDVPFGDTVPAQGLFTVRYTNPSAKWFAEWEWRFVDTVDRVDPDSLTSPNVTQFGSITSLEGYDRYSLRGGYKFDTQHPLRLTLGIENMTDEFFFEPYQLAPAPGRAIVLGVHTSWTGGS